MPSHAGHERMRKLAEYYHDHQPSPDQPIAPVKIDRKLTFDRLTNVHYSGTRHIEDQPSHLIVHDTDICRTRCRVEYGNPCTRFCPANVYEMVDDGEGGKTAAHQRLELRALQDVRHHGSLPDHRLGAARRRRGTPVRRDVTLPRRKQFQAAAIAAARGAGHRSARRHVPLASNTAGRDSTTPRDRARRRSWRSGTAGSWPRRCTSATGASSR